MIGRLQSQHSFSSATQLRPASTSKLGSAPPADFTGCKVGRFIEHAPAARIQPGRRHAQLREDSGAAGRHIWLLRPGGHAPSSGLAADATAAERAGSAPGCPPHLRLGPGPVRTGRPRCKGPPPGLCLRETRGQGGRRAAPGAAASMQLSCAAPACAHKLSRPVHPARSRLAASSSAYTSRSLHSGCCRACFSAYAALLATSPPACMGGDRGCGLLSS